MKGSDEAPCPPRIARAILRHLLRVRGHGDFEPELAELFRGKASALGKRRATAWYWRQVLGFLIRMRSIRRPSASGSRNATAGDDNRVFPLDGMIQDVRFGLRTLKRRPLFASVAIATLGLGIGATTTIYSVVDATLLKELPYPEAEGLVSIWTSRLSDRGEWVTESLYPPEYRRLRDQSSTLENVALYYYAGGSLQGHGDPMNLMVGEGTATLADVAGIQPQLGRWFRPEEVGPEKTYVAVLGDGLWRDRFDADPEVVGTTILLEHRPYTVIGVAPPEFRFRLGLFQDNQGLLSPQETGERPVWVPSGHNYGSDWYDATEGWSFEALGRLKPGVSLEAAQAEIETLVRGEIPADRIQVHIGRRDRMEIAGLPSQLLLLIIPSTLLLAIACGNVATLLLGESEGRRAEVATRKAIGAGRARIVRQLLTENVILGLAGSALGVLIAVSATKILVAYAPTTSAIETVRMNPSVLLMCSLVGFLCGIAFGLAPALSLSRRGGDPLQHHGGRHTSPGRSRVNFVLGLEVALTVVLLVSGGLFTRTLLNLNRTHLGFERENLVAFRAAIDDGTPGDERGLIYSAMAARMEEVPGVESATGSWAMPSLMSLWRDEIATDQSQLVEGATLPRVRYDMVMPNYHETMGVRLLAGRHFSFSDGPGSAPVVIVSESTASRLWPDEPAVGKQLWLGMEEAWHTVVGVVEDVKYQGLDSEPESPVYRPFLQDPGNNGIRLVLTARTTVDPWSISKQIEEAARGVHPSVLLREGAILSTVISDTATDQRYRALLVMAFGLAAVVLAAVGIFGVVARAVAQRSRELAIRVALGGETGSLQRLVLGGTLATGMMGMGVGLVIAGWGSRFVDRFLFGIRATDPATYAVVTVAVLGICLLAGYLPARRLMRLQPARVLKEE